MVEKLERLYTVPLSKAFEHRKSRRTIRAVNLLREFIVKHMKSAEVKISTALNEHLWARSITKPPRRVKIRAVKEDGKVNVYLPDEKPEEKKAEKKETPKEENKTEAPKADKKEEPKKAEKKDEPKKAEKPAKKEKEK